MLVFFGTMPVFFGTPHHYLSFSAQKAFFLSTTLMTVQQQRMLYKQENKLHYKIAYTRAYIKDLLFSLDSSISPFFRECLCACIEKQVKDLKGVTQKLKLLRQSSYVL
jgi:hypothetical protein